MASEGQDTGGSGSASEATRLDLPPPRTPKLRRIEITDYKAIDHLVLDIPAPTMPGDPDIFVVGSKNGVGKTSLLECCAIAQLEKGAVHATIIGDELKASIRSGATSFTIVSHYEPGGSSSLVVRERDDREFLPTASRLKWRLQPNEIEALFGRSQDPLLRADLLLFHSHRKVAEGPLRLQQMLDPREAEGSSALKFVIISMLLAKSGLLEDFSESEAEFPLDQLNQMLATFTGGRGRQAPFHE